MWQSMQPFFEWHAKSWLAERISGSIWLFPFIETIHILAMAVMFGGMLVLNIKMLGLGFSRQPLPLLSKTLQRFINWGIWIMLISGYMMFCSEAMKCYTNDGFKFKMAFLLAALIFQWTMYRKVVATDTQSRSGLAVGTALLCFFLWFGVGVGGRAIGFV